MLMNIPVVKAKGTTEVESDNIPVDLYEYALFLGLKQILNRGMVGEKGCGGLEGAALRDRAMAIAEKNKADLLAGKTRKTGGLKVTEKVSDDREISTEAMRIARLRIRAAMKRQGIKARDVKAAEITAEAKKLIGRHPSILDEAKANVAKMREQEAAVEDLGDLTTLIDKELKARNDAEAEAKRKTTADKRRSGMTGVVGRRATGRAPTHTQA